jgi:hypothetical protein
MTPVQTASTDCQFTCTKVLAVKDITFSTARSFPSNEENSANSGLASSGVIFELVVLLEKLLEKNRYF